jgi:molybdenum cofactor cytidylyltransferase
MPPESIHPIAGIVLAAGRARRFGRPKLLAPLAGRPVIEWVLRAALASRLDRVLLVAAPAPEPLAEAVAAMDLPAAVEMVLNPAPDEGQSASLRAGLDRVAGPCPAVVFLLGDQPLVSPALIDRVIAGLEGSGRSICLPVHRGRLGNPVAFTRRHYAEILALRGDVGARSVVAAHPEARVEVEVADPRVFLDVDTPADLAAAAALLAAGAPPA